MTSRKQNTADRWISPDPAGTAAVDLGNPQSWNRYAYSVNLPTSIIDPTGLLGVKIYQEPPGGDPAWGTFAGPGPGGAGFGGGGSFAGGGLADLWPVPPDWGGSVWDWDLACMGPSIFPYACFGNPSGSVGGQYDLGSGRAANNGNRRPPQQPQKPQQPPKPTLKQNFCFYTSPAGIGGILSGVGLGMGSISWGGTLTTLGLSGVEVGSFAVGAATVGPYLAVGGAVLLVARGAMC